MNPIQSIAPTIKRAQAWIKKNPKAAAAVGVGVVILAYFAIKKGSQASGEELTGGAVSEDSTGFDSLGSGGGSMGGGNSDGESIASLTSEGGSNPSAFSLPSFDSGSYDSGFDLSGESFLPALAPSGFVNSSPAFPASSESIINKAAPVSTPLASIIGGGASQQAAKATAPAPAPVSTPLASIIGGGASQQAAKATAPAPAPITTPLKSIIGGGASQQAAKLGKTDAEKAGLSKFFTGTNGGKIYTAGFVTGTVKTSTPAKTTIKAGVGGGATAKR